MNRDSILVSAGSKAKALGDLSIRHKFLLRLLDGRRSLGELRGLSPRNFADIETLAADLVRCGLAYEHVTANSAPKPDPAVTASETAPLNAEQLAAAKQHICDLVQAIYGPMARAHINKVQACQDTLSLVRTAKALRETIRESFNPRKADAFWQSVKRLDL